VVLGDLDPLPIRQRTIQDPWGASDAVFEDSYSRIERCVRELARTLGASARAAGARAARATGHR
jgi:hypothetical protein